MDSKPFMAMTLAEALDAELIKIERRSNSKRNLEPKVGWFQDPDDLDLFWKVLREAGQWAIYGYECMGKAPVSPGGWLEDDIWVRLKEITVL